MSSTISLIIFIVVASLLFPLAGYFLDWKHYRKMRTHQPEHKKNKEKKS